MLIVGDSISGSKKEIRIKASTFVEEGNTVEGKVESKHPIQIVGSSKSQNSTNKNVTNADNSVKKNNSITFINPGGSFAEKIFGIGKATVGNNVIVQFEPAELTPGDTALVKIYKKDANGELIPYPAGQKFEVGILDGCDYGDLLVNNTRGTYFTNIEEPIKYIAEDNISVDSAKVSLRVGIVQTANQSATFMQPIAAGANYSKKRRVKTAASSGKNINKLTATSCSLEPFVYDEYGTGNVIFKKGVKIELIGPIVQEPFIYWISQTPTMPTIPLRAVRTGFWNLTGETANWTCTLSYNYPIIPSNRMPNGTNLTDTLTYTGESTFDENDMTEWDLNFNNGDPIIGGEAVITVTATVDGEQYADTIVVYIRGENPTHTNVEDSTDDHGQLTMLRTENPGGYTQFDTETYAVPNDGLPVRSDIDNHGWGMGQIDDRYHIITTGMLWDWTENLDWSLNYYNGRRNLAEGHLESTGGNLNNPISGQTRQSMIDFEGYAKYNGGDSAQVWEWVPPDEDNNIPGHWIRYVTTIQNGERLYSQAVDIHVHHYENNY